MQNSLFISLLAGNLGRRLVRSGLPPQPVPSLSRISVTQRLLIPEPRSDRMMCSSGSFRSALRASRKLRCRVPCYDPQPSHKSAAVSEVAKMPGEDAYRFTKPAPPAGDRTKFTGPLASQPWIPFRDVFWRVRRAHLRFDANKGQEVQLSPEMDHRAQNLQTPVVYEGPPDSQPLSVRRPIFLDTQR